jgi:hypothetical protein
MEAHLELAHERLVEWGEEKHYPGFIQASGGALGRLVEEGRDERLKATRRRDARFRLALRKIGIKLGRRRKSDRGMPCKETRAGRMEILTHAGQSFPFAPDGGLGGMVDRMAESIFRNRRCREIGELIDMMPNESREFVRATYGTCVAGHVPRSAIGAAEMMEVSERTYYRRKNEALEWLAERLGLRSAVAA